MIWDSVLSAAEAGRQCSRERLQLREDGIEYLEVRPSDSPRPPKTQPPARGEDDLEALKVTALASLAEAKP
jgi:hypothetical protein